MKAIIITEPGGPEVLAMEERPEPAMGPDEVLVRVEATALNRADLLQRRGLYPAPVGSPPDIPGLEFAGTVHEVGERVTEWKPGDRVMGLLGGGGYAEFVATHERLLLPVPNGMEFTTAAAIPEAYLTAFDAVLVQLALRMGETLLIHAAASGVGIAALQLAKAAGASLVAGTTRTASKLGPLTAMGFDAAIDTSSGDFASAVLEATGGEGVHAVLDLVGASGWAGNMKALRPRGRLIVVGLVGGVKAELDLRPVLAKRLTVMGTVLRARPLEEKAALTQAFRVQALPHFESGRLAPVVDAVYPVSAAADAHRLMEENRNIGKIVLSWHA